MGLNFANINTRPFVNPDGRKPVNKKQDEEKSAAPERELYQSNAKSRGLEVVDSFQQSANVYSQETEKPSWEAMRNQIKAQPKFTRNIAPAVTAPQPENVQPSISTTINIAQILKDFRNTALAIGTPADLQEEVDGYLSLINAQVQKENPNVKLIKSNLKNASTILDNYITETLQKESKVVENWVDAIFLQQIDFKYNENDINPQFLVKFPERTQNQVSAQETVVSEDTVAETKPETPKKPEMDAELKALFVKSKHLAKSDNPKAALLSFQKALKRAEELGENSVKSKIYLEVGDIYNDYDYLTQALTSYNMSVENATENAVKVKAHYNMAQIYDEVNQISPALDHYYTSVAFAGEEDNLNAQTVSLTKMGNIYADMYDEEALDYYDNARDLAIETANPKMRGFVASNAATSLRKFGEPKAALHEYSEAVQYYTKADSPLKIAQNYNLAADLMIEYHNINKAKNLLEKGLANAIKSNNAELIKEINEKLEVLT